MIEPKRLFDCLSYHLEKKPLEVLLAGKESGQWKTYSTGETSKIVNDLSAGLLSMGIGPNDMTVEGRDKVAILCKNRPEWLLLDLAVQQIGALLTPIYPTINVNELEFVLNDAQVKMVFVNDEYSFNKVMSIKDRLPSVKAIFAFEHVVNAQHWKEVMAQRTPELIAKIKPIADRGSGIRMPRQ
jgi:long-chain acyl-CoA synthetase